MFPPSDTQPRGIISMEVSTLDGAPPKPRNVPALITAGGAALAALAFFLPWFRLYNQNGGINPDGSPALSITTLSGWNLATRLFGVQAAGNDFAVTQFFLIGLPLIMAVIALAVALADMRQTLALWFWGGAVAASVMGVLGLFFQCLYFYLEALAPGTQFLFSTNYGLIVAFAGYLVLLTGCISGLAQRR